MSGVINISTKIINEIHRPVFNGIVDKSCNVVVYVLYGGRGAAKTEDVAKICLLSMLSRNGFRGILIRNVQGDVEGGQMSTILRVAGNYKADRSLINFRGHPRSISSKRGGRGSFGVKGMKDSTSVKSSFDNHNFAWIEEADQINEEDFHLIYTSLRHKDYPTAIVLTLNTELRRGKTNWVYEKYFKERDKDAPKTFSIEETTVVDGNELRIKTHFIHSTYRDNPHCPQSLIMAIESLKSSNPAKYNCWANGEWELIDELAGDSWLPSWGENKEYIKRSPEEIKELIDGYTASGVTLLDFGTFDFNINPYTSLKIRVASGKAKYPIIIIEKEIKVSGKKAQKEYPFSAMPLEAVCKKSSELYKGRHVLITGDPSGWAGTDGKSHYDTIRENIANCTIVAARKAESLESSRERLLDQIQNNTQFFISTDCVELLADLEICVFDNIEKYGFAPRKDRGMYKLDSLDALRYFLDYILN